LIESAPHIAGIPILVHVPAFSIVMLITWLLLRGARETATANNIMVAIKLVALSVFILVGATHLHTENYQPFAPNGFTGIHQGAAIVFFAYIGFDAISTAAEECVDPGRDMPRGIIGSLAICTVLYIAAALVLTGMIPYRQLVGVADPLAAALAYVNQGWAAGFLAAGAVIAMTAVLLVFQLGQPRILLAMSRDGLLSPWFAKIHPRYRTPHVSTILTGVFVGFFSAIANIDEIVQLTNIGTLFAFSLVCMGILILRRREPDRPRRFRVPFVPVTPLLGIGMCLFLMAGLPGVTWIRFALWLLAGLVLYFVYGARRSRLATAA
jgi:APA family basic amino acid/polyamine antiporter